MLKALVDVSDIPPNKYIYIDFSSLSPETQLHGARESSARSGGARSVQSSQTDHARSCPVMAAFAARIPHKPVPSRKKSKNINVLPVMPARQRD